MGSDPIISVENLGKSYRLGANRSNERYTALRDVISDKARSLVRGNGYQHDERISRTQEFWALKNVSFEVKTGEIVGIIGRNGAGKSTLLKILSRITEPTEGRIRIRGRVASLLEVGTGFHPELTGRENIFLNGAILGMTRGEITKKFDEIVAFAEVEQFLDTPVKRYSSGMYVRLAFAVAAHLEPEILIVDEVLAVGDAEFQRKCLGKMQDVSKGGRTVLFVSHDMRSVSNLCETGILLSSGRIEWHGQMSDVVAKYLAEHVVAEGYADLSQRGDRSGSADARFHSVEVVQGKARSSTVCFDEPLTIRMNVIVKTSLGRAHVAVLLATADGMPVHGLENMMEGEVWDADAGEFEINVTIPRVRLFPGAYVVHLWLGDHHRRRVDYLTNAIRFEVIQTSDSGLPLLLDRSNGVVFQESSWRCTRVADRGSSSCAN